MIFTLAMVSVLLGAALGDGESSLAISGGYKITKKLGDGECGQAWEAQSKHGKVCVKVSKHQRRGKEQDELRKEARVLKTLQEAGISDVPQYIELFDEGENVELVMGLVENAADLRDGKLRVDHFTYAQGKHILRRVAQTIAAAHNNNIAHRDLHGGNIMVGFANRRLEIIEDVKVIDWSRKARATQRYKEHDGGAFMVIILEVLRLCRVPEDKQLRAEYNELMEYAQSSAARNSRGLKMINEL